MQQAQRLAAKHDPSGKMFNIGEVVTLEDGSVKSKEGLAIAEQRKAEEEAAKATKETHDPSQEPPKKGRMSKRHPQKQAALQPRPTPPRPVIPEGISVPEGEENFIAMWDITDEEIQRRLSEDKQKKSLARRDLRRQQKAQKKINKAMKLLKKQTENRGAKWDPIEGRKIVMEQHEGESSEDSDDSSEDDDSENEGHDGEEVKIEEVDKVEEAEQPVESAKVEKKSKQSKKAKESEPASRNAVVEPPAPISEPDLKQAKTSKRAAEDAPIEEPKAKKSKKSKRSKKSQSSNNKSNEVNETVDATATVELEPATTEENKDLTKEEKRSLKEQKRAQKEEKRAKKEKKKHQEESAKAIKSNGESSKSSKKRKHEDDAADAQVENKKAHKKTKLRDPGDSSVLPRSDLPPSLDKHDRYYTNVAKAKEEPVKESGVAAQWNPEALTGEAARKDKFLRLLGAGKANAKAADGAKHKSSAKIADISKVQSDLERQYEAGMKMKHDGGGKRRGLGA